MGLMYSWFEYFLRKINKSLCTLGPCRLALENFKRVKSGMPLMYKHPKVPKRPLYWAPSRQTAPQKKCKNFMSAVVAFSAWVWQVNARCAMRCACAHARNFRKGALPRTSLQGERLWIRLRAYWTHPGNTLPSIAWALLESIKNPWKSVYFKHMAFRRRN